MRNLRAYLNSMQAETAVLHQCGGEKNYPIISVCSQSSTNYIRYNSCGNPTLNIVDLLTYSCMLLIDVTIRQIYIG